MKCFTILKMYKYRNPYGPYPKGSGSGPVQQSHTLPYCTPLSSISKLTFSKLYRQAYLLHGTVIEH